MLTDSDGFYKLALNHCGGKNYEVPFPENATGDDLVEWVENTLDVPRYQTKIIFRGKLITDEMGSFTELNIPRVGAKMMILGKKNSPEEEKLFKQIQEIVKKSQNYDVEVSQLSEQYDKSIRQNHLPAAEQPKAFDKIRKRMRFCAEQHMKHLEAYDMMNIKADFKEAKSMRKNAIHKIQRWLDNGQFQI